jgi:uncharacterized phage-associated protein
MEVIMIPTRRVVNAILSESAKQGVKIDHLKLQKLLFLTAGFYSAKSGGTALIPEQFGVWEYGPVVESLYHEFKKFGSQPIEGYATEFDSERGKSVAYIPADKEVLFWTVLRAVLSQYSNWSGGQLSTLTHETNSPWATAKQSRQSFIDPLKIKEFYSQQLHVVGLEPTASGHAA